MASFRRFGLKRAQIGPGTHLADRVFVLSHVSSLDALKVTLVSDHAQTIESLRQYLSAAGVDAQVMRQLPASGRKPALGHALILFPDEFDTALVLTTIETLHQACSELRLLLVTSFPQRYQVPRLMQAEYPPIIMPKPAFGWSILDQIRALSPARGET